MSLIHATAIAVDGKGILLRGPSGAGKSDLALRLIDAGAVLVADDQVTLTSDGKTLWASAPPSIAGLLEIRGLGIRRLPHLPSVPVHLLVDLAPADQVERLQEQRHQELDDIQIPAMSLAPFEVSATAKLLYAIRREAVDTTIDTLEAVSMPVPSHQRAKMLLVTGMSGAGRSSALKVLEDMGYEAVDNLPVSLLPRLTQGGDTQLHPIAVGVDVRTREFNAESLVREVERLKRVGEIECRLVFLECDDDILARRYTETRRRHPLAGDRPVIDGIQLERALLRSLRDCADLVLDTSSFRNADLKRVLTGNFALSSSLGLSLFVTSFSFREGLPRDADLVFDVRFLDNPHYDRTLQPLTGLDPRVASFVMADPSWSNFFGSLTTLLETLLPRYDGEGKSYLTIAIGCTGGRHRSVCAAERLGQWLGEQGLNVSVGHRDIDRFTNNAVSSMQRPASCEDAKSLRTLE